MKPKRVHHVGVVVDDIAAVVEFMTETLGLDAAWTIDRPERHKAVFFPCGDTYIEMTQFFDPGVRLDHSGLDAEMVEFYAREPRAGEVSARIEHIALEVADIDEAYTELAQAGVEAATSGPIANALGRVFTTVPQTSDGVRYQFVELGPDAPQ